MRFFTRVVWRRQDVMAYSQLFTSALSSNVRKISVEEETANQQSYYSLVYCHQALLLAPTCLCFLSYIKSTDLLYSSRWKIVLQFDSIATCSCKACVLAALLADEIIWVAIATSVDKLLTDLCLGVEVPLCVPFGTVTCEMEGAVRVSSSKVGGQVSYIIIVSSRKEATSHWCGWANWCYWIIMNIAGLITNWCTFC